VNVVMNLQVPRNAGNVACFLPGRAKDLSAPLYYKRSHEHFNLLLFRVVILIDLVTLAKHKVKTH